MALTFDDAPHLAMAQVPAVLPPTRPALRTTIIGLGDDTVLTELFERIDTTYFRPHPMDLDEARRIGARSGDDIYLIGYADDEAVAYGMLRGWDEGYSTPSLGVAVRSDRIRLGYGRAMMLALHAAARTHGSDRVRLRVNPANIAALSLYRSLGYRPGGFERGELVMYFDL